MAKRMGSIKIAAKGIFAGAIVVRGPDWEWYEIFLKISCLRFIQCCRERKFF